MGVIQGAEGWEDPWVIIQWEITGSRGPWPVVPAGCAALELGCSIPMSAEREIPKSLPPAVLSRHGQCLHVPCLGNYEMMVIFFPPSTKKPPNNPILFGFAKGNLGSAVAHPSPIGQGRESPRSAAR